MSTNSKSYVAALLQKIEADLIGYRRAVHKLNGPAQTIVADAIERNERHREQLIAELAEVSPC